MWLGIDIGTSAVKAVVIDDDGGVVAQATAPLSVSRPQPLWSEQDPEDWWSATEQAVLSLPGDAAAQVRGVGLAGQMHGAVLLDAELQVLRPAILWNDGRAYAECGELERRVPGLPRITGNRAMAGFTAPKLLWASRNEPGMFKDTAKVLLPKDYVRLRLTGTCASDMSDSAGTLWLDVAKRSWSAEMLATCGLDESHMPQLFEGTAISGHLDPAVAARLGLPGVPVAAGGGDNAAGAVGMGLTEPGDAFLSLGTSGVLFAVSDGFAPNTDRAVHAFCHAVPDRWHQMAVVLSAASCLDWVARLTGFADVSNAVTASEQAVDAHVPVFLPYLSGERTPHNDPHAKGVFFGLGHGTGSPELVRGVLEGVAFALADGAEALRSAGTRLDALTVIGGGARSRFWGCIIASALDCELEYRANGDVGPALGAARLAQIAVTRDFRAGLAKPPVLETVKPDADMAKALAPRHRLFRRLYTDLRPAFAQAAL